MLADAHVMVTNSWQIWQKAIFIAHSTPAADTLCSPALGDAGL